MNQPAFTLLALLVSLLAKGAEIRIGLIGLDTSHVTAFTEIINNPAAKDHVAGAKVVAAFKGGSPDIESSWSRVPEYTKTLTDKYGVKIYDTIEGLCQNVDAVMLESVDGRPHLEQARPVIAAKKPLYIDKPMAGSLREVKEIFRLASRANVPVFSASSLRFAKGTLAARNGEIGTVTNAWTSSPAHLEKTHRDLFWYGIHGVESLFTIMGPGCETVRRRLTSDGKIEVEGRWTGGRTGVFLESTQYSGKAMGPLGSRDVGSYDGYAPLVAEVVKFFRTGSSPVPMDETLAIFAFMEGADESVRRGGVPIRLSDMHHAAVQIPPARIRLTGDWTLEVTVPSWAGSPEIVTNVNIRSPEWLQVRDEAYELPAFSSSAGGWAKGAQLKRVKAQGTTTPHLLDPNSLAVRDGVGTSARAFSQGQDFQADTTWGTVGRIPGGSIGEKQTVYVSYAYAPLRLDGIILNRRRQVEVREGVPASAAPRAPDLRIDERRLANIWLPGMVARLTSNHVFTVMEAPQRSSPSSVRTADLEKLIPNTMGKLTNGGKLRILAWGDSVTEAGYLRAPARERWQEQFAERLRRRFGRASIELVTEAWGGQSIEAYLLEPPGSVHNFQEKIIGAKPDLVISEFVNDAGFPREALERNYSRVLAEFRSKNIEWIVCVPHYTRPDWMNLDRERDVDDDPRPYTAFLREFCSRNPVGLADAGRFYGRLWRQGVPYTSWMVNSINHPNADGMGLYAEALQEVFGF